MQPINLFAKFLSLVAVCLPILLGSVRPANAQIFNLHFPDLIIPKVQFYYQDISQPNGGYKLYAVVKSQGNAASKACFLRMRRYAPFFGGSVQVGEETKFVPVLLPGQQVQISNFHLYDYHYAGVKVQFLVDSTNH